MVPSHVNVTTRQNQNSTHLSLLGPSDKVPSSDEMEAGEVNPTGRQDTQRSRDPKPRSRQVAPEAAISGHQQY